MEPAVAATSIKDTIAVFIHCFTIFSPPKAYLFLTTPVNLVLKNDLRMRSRNMTGFLQGLYSNAEYGNHITFQKELEGAEIRIRPPVEG
jgi:hypothetical protein